MAISVTIRPQDASTGGTDVSIPTGEGAIDTREEARAVLAAIPSGQDASNKVFIAGGQRLSYAEITGLACLGRIPRHTVFASQDNWVLSHPGQCLTGTVVPPPPPPPPPPVTETRAGEAMTLPDAAAVRAIGGLRPDAEILGVQFDSLPEMTTAPYAIPASAMTAGPHQLRIRYRNPGETQIRVQTVTINAGDNIGGASGAVLTMPATASRPALVAGQPAAAIPVGNVQTTAGFPANSTYQLYVDGNPVGTAQPLPADRNTPLTLPSSVADGAHQVQLRVLRPNQATILYPTINVTVGPAFPTLSAADAVPDATAPIYGYNTAPFSVMLTSSSPGWVRITAGGNHWDKQVTAGANTVALLNRGEARQYYVGPVSIQPITASGGTLVGTAVQSAHPVTLGRRVGGGHHPAPRPPRL